MVKTRKGDKACNLVVVSRDLLHFKLELPISAWLKAAARRGFPAVQIRQKKPSADW